MNIIILPQLPTYLVKFNNLSLLWISSAPSKEVRIDARVQATENMLYYKQLTPVIRYAICKRWQLLWDKHHFPYTSLIIEVYCINFKLLFLWLRHVCFTGMIGPLFRPVDQTPAASTGEFLNQSEHFLLY